MRRLLSTPLCFLLWLNVFTIGNTAGPAARAGNLISNGTFEKGAGAGPDGWEKPDGLTVQWKPGGVHGGKALILDTTVLRKEAERNQATPGAVTEKSAYQGKGYDTVGGSSGAGLWSAPFPVEPGQWYLIEADVKAGSAQTSSIFGPPMVCLRGFRPATEKELANSGSLNFFHPMPGTAAFSDEIFGTEKRPPAAGDQLQVFRANLFCKVTDDQTGKWTHFGRPVHIPTDRFRCDTALIHLAAFWPPSQYAFDNVSVRKITPEEAERWKVRQAGEPVP